MINYRLFLGFCQEIEPLFVSMNSHNLLILMRFLGDRSEFGFPLKITLITTVKITLRINRLCVYATTPATIQSSAAILSAAAQPLSS